MVFCPSLGSAHQFHSIAETKIKAVKIALGSMDLSGTKLDSISLGHKLDILASHLNDIPIICRIRSQDKTNLNNIITRTLTPNILTMRKGQGFINPLDPKLWKIQDSNIKLQEQIDKLSHEVLVLIHRHQTDRTWRRSTP